MIIDHLDNAECYYGLSAGIKAGLRFLKTANLANLLPGKKEIEGEKLFAVVSEYTTKDEASVKWEAHRRYIDIQYVVQGAEAIGYQHVSKLEPVSEYNAKNDVIILQGHLPAANRLSVPEGFFTVFFPCDAHRPGMSMRRPQKVKKIVVKVRVN